MRLAEAVGQRVHDRNPTAVHRHYEPGKCPWCGVLANLREKVRTQVPGIVAAETRRRSTS